MRKSKDIFRTYSIAPFGCDIVIFRSHDLSRITAHLNMKKNANVSKWLKNFVSEVQVPEGAGAVLHVVKTGRPLIVFMKDKGSRKWDWYNTLIHEVNHLVEDLADHYNFHSEKEFKAYLTETLFTDIRRIIE